MNIQRPISPLSRLAGAVALALLSLATAASAKPDADEADTAGTARRTKDLAELTVKASGYASKVAAGALGNLSEVDTPFSTTTVATEQLLAKQPNNLAQVFSADAAVSSGGGDYSPYANDITIRGLPLDQDNGTKIDGMPFETYAVNLPLEMMDSVELLKGASAFMYGFGAPGGVVNYVTKKTPESGSILSFDAGYRSSNIYSEHIDAGTRFGEDERFGVRANVANRSGTSYSGADIRKDYSASLALDARLSDDVTWTFDSLYHDSNVRRQPPGGYYTLDSSYTSAMTPAAISGDTRVGSDTGFINSRMLYLSSGLDWKLSENWKLDFNVAYTDSRSRDDTDWIYFTSGNGDYYNGRWAEASDDEYKFAQLMLSGAFDTGPIHHNVVAGLSYNHHWEYYGENEDYEDSESYGNLYSGSRDSWYIDAGKLVPGYLLIEKAVFFSDTMDIGERWKAIVGLRYTDFSEKTWSTDDSSGTIASTAGTTYRKHPLTPTLALMYKPTGDSTVYASYVQSMEKGSVVGSSYTNVGQALQPLKSTQYELGYKLETPVCSATVAAFRLDKGAEYENAAGAYVSGGTKRYQGVDAAFNWHLDDALTLGLSVIRMEAHYLDVDNDWLTGKTVYGATPFRAVASAHYRFNRVPGLDVHASVRYSGRTRVANNVASEISVDAPAYTLTDIGGGYTTQVGGHPLTFTAGINNLFDRKYWSTAQQAFFLGAPREVFSNVKLDF